MQKLVITGSRGKTLGNDDWLPNGLIIWDPRGMWEPTKDSRVSKVSVSLESSRVYIYMTDGTVRSLHNVPFVIVWEPAFDIHRSQAI